MIVGRHNTLEDIIPKRVLQYIRNLPNVPFRKGCINHVDCTNNPYHRCGCTFITNIDLTGSFGITIHQIGCDVPAFDYIELDEDLQVSIQLPIQLLFRCMIYSRLLTISRELTIAEAEMIQLIKFDNIELNEPVKDIVIHSCKIDIGCDITRIDNLQARVIMIDISNFDGLTIHEPNNYCLVLYLESCWHENAVTVDLRALFPNATIIAPKGLLDADIICFGVDNEGTPVIESISDNVTEIAKEAFIGKNAIDLVIHYEKIYSLSRNCRKVKSARSRYTVY